VAQFAEQEWGAGARPGDLNPRLDQLGGDLADQPVVGERGDRLGRVAVHVDKRRRRDLRPGVHLRLELAQRGEDAVGLRSVAVPDAVDHHQLPAA
jgi:hypothetical protein